MPPSLPLWSARCGSNYPVSFAPRYLPNLVGFANGMVKQFAVQEGGKSFRVNRDNRGLRAGVKRDQTVPFGADGFRVYRSQFAVHGSDRR